MTQTVSMFSCPYSGRRLFAIVPEPMFVALNRLEADDPIWRRGEEGDVRFEKSWEIDTERYRVRLRNRLKAWLA